MSSSNRKRKRPSASSSKVNDSSPLNGLTLAISTVDVKGQQHVNRDVSYKAIQALVRKMGGNPTGQVHRRVSALLCTPTSLRNATQRVRKAVKLDIPLVDVAWLYACQEGGGRVDWTSHLLEKEIKVVKEGDSKEEGINPDYEEVPEKGWTDAVDVGCCCVCHENMDPACPWCADCSVNKAKKQKADVDKSSSKEVTAEQVEPDRAEQNEDAETHEASSNNSAEPGVDADVKEPKHKDKKKKKKKKRKKEAK